LRIGDDTQDIRQLLLLIKKFTACGQVNFLSWFFKEAGGEGEI